MLSDFTEKKKPFFTLKTEFFESQKNRIFSMLLVKKCQFFLYLDLVKIRLGIMLNDFAEKKETFFGYKKQNFSKSKKSNFSKGVNPCFWTKNAKFLWFKIMLTDFHRKKKPF